MTKRSGLVVTVVMNGLNLVSHMVEWHELNGLEKMNSIPPEGP